MNPVKIENEYKKIDFDKELITIDSDYYLDSETLILLDDIDISNRDTVKYVVYKILLKSKVFTDLNPTPKNGIEFVNKINRKEYLGIYHIHLNNEMVLIWYIELKDNQYYLKLEYLKHPKSYKDILKSIYNKPYAYDVYKKEFLKNCIHNTEFNENKYILNFKTFLNRFR